jgi:hypothetical protein
VTVDGAHCHRSENVCVFNEPGPPGDCVDYMGASFVSGVRLVRGARHPPRACERPISALSCLLRVRRRRSVQCNETSHSADADGIAPTPEPTSSRWLGARARKVATILYSCRKPIPFECAQLD